MKCPYCYKIVRDIPNHLRKVANIMKKFKIGDKVYIYSMTSMGSGSEGYSTITDIKTRYGRETGEPYDEIWFDDHRFDSRNGNAISRPFMFYIKID